jgi:hypothetical protein
MYDASILLQGDDLVGQTVQIKWSRKWYDAEVLSYDASSKKKEKYRVRYAEANDDGDVLEKDEDLSAEGFGFGKAWRRKLAAPHAYKKKAATIGDAEFTAATSIISSVRAKAPAHPRPEGVKDPVWHWAAKLDELLHLIDGNPGLRGVEGSLGRSCNLMELYRILCVTDEEKGYFTRESCEKAAQTGKGVASRAWLRDRIDALLLHLRSEDIDRTVVAVTLHAAAHIYPKLLEGTIVAEIAADASTAAASADAAAKQTARLSALEQQQQQVQERVAAQASARTGTVLELQRRTAALQEKTAATIVPVIEEQKKLIQVQSTLTQQMIGLQAQLHVMERPQDRIRAKWPIHNSPSHKMEVVDIDEFASALELKAKLDPLWAAEEERISDDPRGLLSVYRGITYLPARGCPGLAEPRLNGQRQTEYQGRYRSDRHKFTSAMYLTAKLYSSEPNGPRLYDWSGQMESAGIARLETHLKGMSINKDGEGGDGINDDEDAYYLYTAVQWAVSQGPGVPNIDE